MEYMVEVEPQVRVYLNDINPAGKKPVLFLHGWPASHRMFEYQYNALLAMGCRCIGMDMRGFGKSDKPLSGYGYDRLADDVRGVIEFLHAEDLTLAGHSTGGAVAARYMARHGGYGVARLALLAAAAPSLIRRPGFPYGISGAEVEDIIGATGRDRPQMLRDFGETFFYRKVTPAFAQWFFLMGLEAASWSTMAVSRAWLVETLFDDLAKIRVPTLILHGIHDRVCLFPLAVAQHEAVAGSVLVPFKNSGHGLFYDEREKFNRELARFLGLS